ncbi:MAG: DUF1475 domain-containing protein [Mariniblastus sp.]|nr:DUF1475 domain-containing protein [Mariniblastus sp.]
MRLLLIVIFSTILLGMIWVTTAASLERNLFTAGAELMADGWFRATLADAYFGFITFFVWVAYRETSWLPRLLWLVAILLLGNIAMAIYMLIRLIRCNPEWPVYSLLLRPEHFGAFETGRSVPLTPVSDR